MNEIPSREASFSWEGAPMSTEHELSNRKLKESRSRDNTYYETAADRVGSSLYHSIKKYGVRSPVAIEFDESDPEEGRDASIALANGHHRVAAAYNIDPKMEIPVKYVGMNGI